MKAKNVENKWLQYYRDAASLRLDIDVIRKDVEFEKQGGKNFYAVDNNIILLYSKPLEHVECIRTFKDEDKLVLEGLAISLADFIFFHGLVSEENDALLFPPPLLEEFLDVYTSICRAADIEKEEVVANHKNIEEINRLIEYSQNEKPDQKLIDHLVNQCPNLVRYLHTENYTGAKAAIERLGRLGKNSRLRDITTEKCLPIPDQAEVIKKGRIWHNLLKQTLKDRIRFRPADRIRNDAKTLAWISLVNEELDAQTSESIKLLYLTADKAVHETACRQIKSGKLKYNFLRYPHQYINFIKLSCEKSTTNLESKLEILKDLQSPVDEFLRPFHINNNEYLANLYKIKNKGKGGVAMIKKALDALQKVDEDETRYDDFTEKRMELLSLSSMSRALTLPEMASDLAKTMREKGIDQLLINRQKDTHRQVVHTLTALGMFGFLAELREPIETYLKTLNKNIDKNHWSRGPVSLRRDMDVSSEDSFFEKIHQALYDKEWVELFQIINDDQLSLYIRNLIYALVAADAGNWHDARTYCKDAVDVANYPCSHEALYFLAVSLRHDCRKYEDYKQAKSILRDCCEVWGKRYPGREDLRFESEELALATAYFNYEKFISWYPDDELQKPELLDIWEKLHSFSQKIENEKKEYEIICLRIKRQVYTNQCCLFIYDQYIGKKEIINEKGREPYEKLKKLKGGKNFRPSYFIHFIVAFSAWHFAESSEKEHARKEALKETIQALEHRQVPYEESKFSRFKSFLETKTV